MLENNQARQPTAAASGETDPQSATCESGRLRVVRVRKLWFQGGFAFGRSLQLQQQRSHLK